MEVLKIYILTASGSHTLASLMSIIFPEFPSIPKNYPSGD